MILIDTHVLVWMAASPERLSKTAAETMPMEGKVSISSVSAQEISYLAMRGKIEFDRPVTAWIYDALAEHEVEVVSPDLETAVRAGSLPSEEFPGDPADRLIYATAVEQGVRLISADQRLREFDPARVVW